MTWNAMWSNRRLRYKAPSTCKILPLSLPKQYVVIFLKGLFLHLQTKALEKERECQNQIHGRQLFSGDICYVTWRSLSYKHLYKHMYIYMLCTFIHKYIYYIYDNIFTSRYTCYLYIWISYIFISTNIIQT